uniref:Guanylate-binding protein 7 n=1 Tax=Sus scrofa TaxID=9823 RepID=A0A8D0VXI8_PIG
MTEERRERERTSTAEQDKRETSGEEKVLLKQHVKKLQHKLVNQENVFQGFRAKMTLEIREKKKLLRNMEERIEAIESFLGITKKRKTCCVKNGDPLRDAEKSPAGAGEPANLEAAQREKELLLQKMMELERRLDDHERILEELRSRMTDGGREMETTSAGDKGEASAFPGREKELLEQHAKALQQDLEDQEEAFQRFRAQMIEEIREIETAQRQMDERIKILEEILLGYQVAMASALNMTDPICLIENNNELLSVNQEALEILEKISQPVVVVAIVGLYRTGKSYLMNRLAGRNHGFRVGSTVQSETKGIWMWCVPHPSKPDRTLVLLDTEGLGDVEKGDPKNDSWIFALAVLLSSVFVYNSTNTINHQALEQLHYVTELTELIRTKSSSENDGVEDCTEFVSFFPDFIWIVRDFTLDLKLHGHPVTEDEYLENALKLIPGNNPKAQISNLPRECIRNFFPKRKCFVFDRPTDKKNLLASIENVSEDQLDPDFLEQANNFCSYIFTNAKTKTLSDGIPVTGKRLGILVVAYVDAINTGDVPCLENAVTTLAQLENSAAMQKAADHYSEQMAQRLDLPADTYLELLEVHADCECEAIAVFMEHSFKDDTQEFQKMLVEIIKNKKEGFVLQNEEASAKYCQEKLDQLSETLVECISAGMFSVPGGHELYQRAKQRLEWDYCHVLRKGVQADKVLQRFLQAQVATERSILQTDKALTDRQKAIAGTGSAHRGMGRSCRALWLLGEQNLPDTSSFLSFCGTTLPCLTPARGVGRGRGWTAARQSLPINSEMSLDGVDTGTIWGFPASPSSLVSELRRVEISPHVIFVPL